MGISNRLLNPPSLDASLITLGLASKVSCSPSPSAFLVAVPGLLPLLLPGRKPPLLLARDPFAGLLVRRPGLLG